VAPAALEGVLVVEIGARIGAGVCASLLAQLGATVVIIEPAGALPGRGKWTDRAQFAAGKLSFTPDHGSFQDKALFERLLEQADVVIESSDCAVDPAMASLPARQGAQVRCDITAFGSETSLDGREWTDLQLQALTGILCTTGLPDGACVPIPIPLVEYLAGTQAAGAVVAALRAARLGGCGQHIDMALYDCGFAAMSSFFSRLLASDGVPAPGQPRRLGNLHTLSAPWNVYRAQDGWVMICTGSNVQWQRLCELMGQGKLAQDARFINSASRVAHVAQVDQLVQQWVGGQAVAACVVALSAASVPAGPITTVAQLPQEENLLFRGMITHLHGDVAKGTPIAAPGSPLRMDRTPGRALTDVPVRGSGRAALLALLAHRRPAAEARTVRSSRPPLQGLCVLEIGHYTTAPVGARCLAALGARVIKIEPPEGEASRGWDPLQHGQSLFYTVSNSDKSSVTINLNQAEDRQCLRQLIVTADVLIENLKPGTLSKFDLSPVQIAQINPQLVYCAISGFGAASLYARRPAFDTVVQGMGGLMSLITDRGMPLKAGISYADVLGAAMAVVAVLAALEYRARSGQGQFIDLSMQDIVAWSTQSAWNRSQPQSAVGRIVQCLDGEVLMPEPASEGALHGLDGSSGTDANSLSVRAQQMLRADFVTMFGGTPVQTPAEVLASVRTVERGLCFTIEDERGCWPALAVPMRLLGTPPMVRRPGPALGRDNGAILGPLRILGQQ
jgi:crotonobetainyl-CoA:carnitine CoA-transferase CaiB-like acyl-CoA transferase